MLPFETELDALEHLYSLLEARLSEQRDGLTSSGREPAAGILEAGTLEDLKEAERLAHTLEQRWREGSRDFTPDERKEIRHRTARLLEQALRLRTRARDNEERIRLLEAERHRSLRKLRAGEMYLRSFQGSRENHPKFIDAHN